MEEYRKFSRWFLGTMIGMVVEIPKPEDRGDTVWQILEYLVRALEIDSKHEMEEGIWNPEHLKYIQFLGRPRCLVINYFKDVTPDMKKPIDWKNFVVICMTGLHSHNLDWTESRYSRADRDFWTGACLGSGGTRELLLEHWTALGLADLWFFLGGPRGANLGLGVCTEDLVLAELGRIADNNDNIQENYGTERNT